MGKESLLGVIIAIVVLMMGVYSTALFRLDDRLNRLSERFDQHVIDHATHKE